MNLDSKIYIAGHRGMVGSAIFRALKSKDFQNIIFRTSSELDLRNQQAVADFFAREKPEYVFLAAASVGGILANSTYRADFIYNNLMIESNIIHSAWVNSVSKLMFLGSSCIYPKLAPQPLKESYLLTGELEPSNEPYAIAKIAGIKLCEGYRDQYGCNFISVMPTNLYGYGDNYDLKSSHVLPALIRKFHEAKLTNQPFVEVWGTGKPKREFLFADDLADACLFLMNTYNEKELVNVGTGVDLSIGELANEISSIIGYEGQISWDSSKPDGTPQKLLDVSKLRSLGWEASTSLQEGIKIAYADFLKTVSSDSSVIS
jgi:GDP-L-fucose synthase